MQDVETFLPDDIRAQLRAPVDLGAGARARVMQRVRAAAALAQVAPRPRGMVRPSVLGALLAASFVAAIVTGGARSAVGGGQQVTIADTIAMHFEAAAQAVATAPLLDRGRLVAAADETRNLVPPPPATPLSAKAIRFD